MTVPLPMGEVSESIRQHNLSNLILVGFRLDP
jgi:hypothetical protein